MSSSASPSPTPAPAAAPASGGSAAPAPDVARPEYIPEKFWDAERKAPRLEDLGKAYVTLEQARGRGKEAFEAERLAKRPEAADKYELAMEGIDPEVLKDHPLVPVIRELAFENGLDQDGFKGLGQKVIGALLAAAPKPEEERAKLGENADARLAAARTFLETTFADPAERDAIAMVGATAAGVRAVEKLIALAQGRTGAEVRPEPTAGGAARKSKAEIHKLMEDPKYWSARHRDPAVIKEVEEWFRQENATR